MTNTACKFNNISEHDMDMLFIEAFVTDPDFPSLFLNKTTRAGKKYSVLSAERSKPDPAPGESDITIVLDVEGERHALLIEDRIYAPDMESEYFRYTTRAQEEARQGKYGTFDMFIVCPRKNRDPNVKKKHYKNYYYVSYEECRDYFATKEDAHSKLWLQQICQAIETKKSEYNVTTNNITEDSFRQYAEYQKMYFPKLKLQNRVESNTDNGLWTHFVLPAKGMYILHKTDLNVVDVTISGAAERLDELLPIQELLIDYLDARIKLVTTGESAAFRIEVPAIRMGTKFDDWDKDKLDSCFEVIQKVYDFADMLDRIYKVIYKSKNTALGG